MDRVNGQLEPEQVQDDRARDRQLENRARLAVLPLVTGTLTVVFLPLFSFVTFSCAFVLCLLPTNFWSSTELATEPLRAASASWPRRPVRS